MPRIDLSHRSGQAGVSLLEVLVVLAVLAVLAGSAVTFLPRTAPPAPLRGMADQLMEDLQRAADRNAVQATGLHLSWGEGFYRITTGPAVIERSLPAGLRLSSLQSSPFRVSPVALPIGLRPLQLEVEDRAKSVRLTFDGVRVHE